MTDNDPSRAEEPAEKAAPETDPGDSSARSGVRTLTYPGAPDSVIAHWMGRRSAVIFGRGESLPPVDFDLMPLVTQIIPPDEPRPEGRISPYRRKLWQLQREFSGLPELALLNADLIVTLRRESYPDHAPALFLRIWREHGAALIQILPGRWLISSVITFGTIGETEAQRRIGLALNVLFSTMKLYEVERTFSGFSPEKVFTNPQMSSRQLPLGMSTFGFRRGGLDFNLLAPIWQEALAEPTVGPLACHLLERLNADPGNIFRRIRQMSALRQAVPEPAPESKAEPDETGIDAAKS